jgi:hypothetical protein
MAAGSVINTVAATAGGAPLEADQLSNQPRVIQQLNPTGIDQRQQVTIQFRLGLGRQLVADAEAAKLLTWKLAGVAVAAYLGDAVAAARYTALYVVQGWPVHTLDHSRTSRGRARAFEDGARCPLEEAAFIRMNLRVLHRPQPS